MSHEKGKILILKLYNKLFSILICNNQILAVQAQNYEGGNAGDALSIGNIYVGRVKNISENIGAAFVEIRKGKIAFLPLNEAKTAIVINRKPDGTIKAGDELIVQLVKEPVKSKLAGISAGLSLSGSYAVVKYRYENTEYDKAKESEKFELPGSVEVSSKLGKKYHNIYKNLEPM